MVPLEMTKVFKTILIIFITLFSCEIGLRIVFPCSNKKPVHGQTGLRPDIELGWINEPGQIITDNHAFNRSNTTQTITDLGSRIANSKVRTGSTKIDIFGCSFTNGGLFLDDTETYPWQLQQLLPQNYIINNFGVPAYSTYQSLLLARRLLQNGEKPQIVIYGFVDFHEDRNIAAPSWTDGLAKGLTYEVELPYSTLDKDSHLLYLKD